MPLSRRCRVLALVALAKWPMLELHASGLLDENMYALSRHVIGWIFVLNVIWACWLLRRLEGWSDKWAVLLLISLALFAGLIAAGIGYMNLGALIIVGIAYSLALLGLVLVIKQFFSDVFDGLDEGRYRWQKAVRRTMGLKDQEYVPGLGWLLWAILVFAISLPLTGWLKGRLNTK